MGRVIAIDGPSGAGKSSVSREVGRRLGFVHVDSGALYRIATLLCLRAGVDTSSDSSVAAFVSALPGGVAGYRAEDGRVKWLVDGEEPGDAIRTEEINSHASEVARVKEVRDAVTATLRSLVSVGDVIVEGRDITSVVFPDTPARFFLTASAEARASRRRLEQVSKGISGESEEAVKASLLRRDAIDSTRRYAPLKKSDGVIEIGSTDMAFDEVVEAVLAALPEDWRK